MDVYGVDPIVEGRPTGCRAVVCSAKTSAVQLYLMKTYQSQISPQTAFFPVSPSADNLPSLFEGGSGDECQTYTDGIFDSRVDLPTPPLGVLEPPEDPFAEFFAAEARLLGPPVGSPAQVECNDKQVKKKEKLDTFEHAKDIKKSPDGKRKRIACTACHFSHVACRYTDSLPCERCIKRGCASDCVPFKPAKKPRKKPRRQRDVLRDADGKTIKRLADKLNKHRGQPCLRNPWCIRPRRHPGHCGRGTKTQGRRHTSPTGALYGAK